MRSAAECIRDVDFAPIPMWQQEPSVRGKLDERRQRLVREARSIHVLRDDEFPADFRTQFREITAEVTGEHTCSIEVGVAALADDRVIALSNKIVELYEDTCEA